MRILRFSVNGQTLSKDNSCDFSGIVAGSKEYLQASFSFDAEWVGRKVAAIFITGNKEVPVPLDETMSCMIPDDVLSDTRFRVYVVGMRKGELIPTNKLIIKQLRG